MQRNRGSFHRFPNPGKPRDEGRACRYWGSGGVALAVVGLLICGETRGICAEPAAVDLPKGVEAVWTPEKAYRESTPTRERICLNGLWQWQPAYPNAKSVPTDQWGYFKVPGCWPGITDYMQKDCQTLYMHPSWRERKLREVTAAWYQREITIPAQWSGRRVSVSLDCLNSYAALYLDGKYIGETRFPAGEVELTNPQAGRHQLTLFVIALPLKGVMLSYTDSASAREQKGTVERRGLCGDVFLVSAPSGARFTDARIETSFRKKQLTVNTALEGLASDVEYRLKARVSDGGNLVKEFTSEVFHAGDLREGRFAFSEPWMPTKLWDINTPQNQFGLEVTLVNGEGKAVDTSWNMRFGFRELWIDGRDFYLNGTRIFLSAVPLDNAQVSAAMATYSAARESLSRLKSFGINFVYTHNYGCQPGVHLAFDEMLRAADDAGMLVSFSQPHFSHYDWKAPGADENNGYARHAAYYVNVAQNHPSVVMYSMSHNATGYDEDMNPDMIDGIHDARDSWALRNVAMATRAAAIVSRLDPTRIVYHHASGNLGPMHAINFYPNFVPIQELSDWFEHWSTQGVKPVFTCEYGAPFTWDWTMYRGWYKGQREFGSAAVPWEFCLAEWNAQFLGDRAFDISEAEKKNLRWEAQQFRADKLWHRWDYPVQVGSSQLEERYPVFAKYIKDNWRAFRTWEVSAVSPWEYEHFWKLRDGVDRRRQEYKTDWQNLQRPGFSPDYQDQRYERMDLAFEPKDWIPTAAAKALMANNGPLLAYLAGKPGAFTSKDHLFRPGEKVEKQLIIINNSREPVTGACEWSLQGSAGLGGGDHFSIPTGQQKRVPISFDLPNSTATGRYELTSLVKLSTSEILTDSFTIDITSKAALVAQISKVALFDPKGETEALLNGLGVQAEKVGPEADLSKYDLLVIGKAALTTKNPAPDLGRVRDGLKVIVFEQTAEALEKRLGFRVEEYGLRQVYPRVPDHPLLAGLTTPQLHDWRGESTLLPRQLKYTSRPQYGPTIEWCGLQVPHLWRCGNRGDVASVLIEKPTKGDFLPIVDGGFSLQYSPLIEYHEGKGVIVFCQMDVTGRSETDPAADTLVRNLLSYVAGWKPTPHREAIYVGNAEGKSHLESIGIAAQPYDRSKLSQGGALIASQGSGKLLAGESGPLKEWLKAGGKLLTVGLDEKELNTFFPCEIRTKNGEHISAFFEAQGQGSFAAGIGPADLHDRDPSQFALVTGGARMLGDGVLAQSEDLSIILDQMPPWQFDDSKADRKRTHRRATFTLSRLLANLGVAEATPLLNRLHQPLGASNTEDRWLSGFYIDKPEEWDDPYRHFRW